MNLINNDYWVRLFNVLDHETSFGLLGANVDSGTFTEARTSPTTDCESLALRWRLKSLSLRIPRRKRRFHERCYYSLGKNDNFPIFTDFSRFF